MQKRQPSGENVGCMMCIVSVPSSILIISHLSFLLLQYRGRSIVEDNASSGNKIPAPSGSSDESKEGSKCNPVPSNPTKKKDCHPKAKVLEANTSPTEVVATTSDNQDTEPKRRGPSRRAKASSIQDALPKTCTGVSVEGSKNIPREETKKSKRSNSVTFTKKPSAATSSSTKSPATITSKSIDAKVKQWKCTSCGHNNTRTKSRCKQ